MAVIHHVRARTRRAARRAALATGALVLAGTGTAGLLAATGTGTAQATTAGPQLTVTPSTSLAFPPTPVGQVAITPMIVTLTNTGTSDVTISGFTFGGPDTDDFVAAYICNKPASSTLFTLTSATVSTLTFGLLNFPGLSTTPTLHLGGSPVTLAPGSTCTVGAVFLPAGPGPRSATITVQDGATSPPVLTLSGTGTEGYYLAGADGAVYAYGNATFDGSMGGKPLNAPIIDMAATPLGGGYWLLGQDGGIFSFGTAPFLGSMGGAHLDAPVVGMTATPFGTGYWEVASDGGIFAFGTSRFYGSMGGKPLNAPIVGMAATPTGRGYWEVASDGGIFAFGDAPFYGSMGGKPLNEPIVGIAATPTGHGYWEVAKDGGIFAFGNAAFYGSMGGQHLNEPIEAIAATPTGSGYWEVASDGGIFAFGNAPFYGSTGSTRVDDVVAIAPTATDTLQALEGGSAIRPRLDHRLKAGLTRALRHR